MSNRTNEFSHRCNFPFPFILYINVHGLADKTVSANQLIKYHKFTVEKVVVIVVFTILYLLSS